MPSEPKHSPCAVKTSSPDRRPEANNRLHTVLRANLRLGSNRDVSLIGWLLLALASSFVAYVCRLHAITHDAFHEMSLFRESLILGTFPTQDLFAYTPTVNPSVHHEWGTGALLYFVTIGTGLGPFGLSLLRFLLIAALWLLLYRVARMRGAHPCVFAITAFVTFPVLWVGFATVRAQLFTLVFIAAQLWMQELDWRGRRGWVLLWLTMLVIWLNLHAGFVVGLGLIAFHGIERVIASWQQHRSWRPIVADTWHLILAAPAAVCLLPINPYGWQYLPYLVHAIGMERPTIREWQPLWQTYSPGITLALFACSVALVLYAWRQLKWRQLRGAAFLGLCVYMAVKHIRHGSIYAVVWIAYVPAWLSRTPIGKQIVALLSEHRLAAIRICQGLTTACLLFAVWNDFWKPTLPAQSPYSTANYPVAAVEYLRHNNFSGNLMTPFHAGAYVSWEMYPQVRVSFDGRYEVAYAPELMPEHSRFYEGVEAWWQILDKYPTDAALIPQTAPLASQLSVMAGDSDSDFLGLPTKSVWRIIYQDDAYLILATDTSPLPALDRRGQPLPDGALEAFSKQKGVRYLSGNLGNTAARTGAL